LRKSFLLNSIAAGSVALLLSAVAQANTPGVVLSSQLGDAGAATFGNYLSAHVAAGDHNMDDAAALYRATLEADPENIDLANKAFLYAAASGDIENAVELAGKVVANNPDDRAARLALAIGAIHRHDFSAARRQLAQSSHGPLTTLILLLSDAWAAQGAGDTPGALKDIDGLNKAGATDALSMYHKALILDLAGRDADAETAYQAALKADATNPRAIDAYGRFLVRAGRVNDARAFYTHAQADDTLAPIVNVGLARLDANEKPDRLVADAQSGAAEGLFGIAASLTDATSADIAVLYLRLALYLRPDFDLGKIVLADRFEALRKFDAAIDVYRSIASSSPYRAAAGVQIAIDEGKLDRKDAAISDLERITAASPNDISAWTSLGDAYRAADKEARAVKAYDKAIALIGTPQKKDWPILFARAVSEEGAKDWDASEADLRAALQLSPDEPEVLNYLGYSWVDHGRNLAQAVAMLEKARALSPYDGYITDSVGWAYFKLGHYTEASKVLEQAVLLVPGDATINEHYGDALWMAGHKLDAHFQWNHALAFNADPKDKAKIEKKLQDGLNLAQARAE
jgi:tetratricopeptide (TPR) repeat protein